MIAPIYVYKLWMKNSKLYSTITKISQVSSTNRIHLSGQVIFPSNTKGTWYSITYSKSSSTLLWR